MSIYQIIDCRYTGIRYIFVIVIHIHTALPCRHPHRDQRFAGLCSSHSHVVLGVLKPCVLQHVCTSINKKHPKLWYLHVFTVVSWCQMQKTPLCTLFRGPPPRKRKTCTRNTSNIFENTVDSVWCGVRSWSRGSKKCAREMRLVMFTVYPCISYTQAAALKASERGILKELWSYTRTAPASRDGTHSCLAAKLTKLRCSRWWSGCLV